MVCHKGKTESTRKRDALRELPRKEIDHRYRKNSKYEGNDSEVSFRVCKGIKEVRKEEEKRKMGVSRFLFVEFYLVYKPGS